MSESGTAKRVGRSVLFALLGAALVMVLLIGIGEGQGAEGASGDVTSATNAWYPCTIENVAAYPERIHVMCVPEVTTGVSYLAAPTTDAAHAARLLSLLSTALVTGRPLQVLFDVEDTDHLPPGCAVGDCRLLLAASMD
jgi:hypothetical protein